METEEVVRPEGTLDSVLPEDTSKVQKYDIYFPDFSDIRDDSYGFWDFLSNKRDASKNIKGQFDEDYRQKNNFWDFLGPSVDEKFQNIAELKDYTKTESFVSSPEDSGIYVNEIIEDSKTQMYPEISTSGPIAAIAENCSNMPELKSSGSDDEFWDFLHCNSPILNFQEVIQNYASVSVGKDTKTSSHFESVEESPLVSDSDYVESGRCSTLSSTSSHFPSNTKYASLNTNCNNNTALTDTRQNSKVKCRNVMDSNIDFTSYDAVLNYLKQDSSTVNREVESGLMMLNDELKSSCGDKVPEHIDAENWHASFSAILAQLNELPSKESGEETQNVLHSATNKLAAIEEKTHGRGDLNAITLPSNTLPQTVESSLPLFRNANQKLNSDGSLPCITSVFSINPPPAILKDNDKSIDPCKTNAQNTEKIHHALNKKQYRRVRSSNISKRPNQNESLHFNKINNPVNTISNSNVSTLGFPNIEMPKMQKQLYNLKPIQGPSDILQGGNTSLGVRNNSGSFNANSVVTQSSTSSVPVMAKNTVNSGPLYLILPPNSASLQNPNYSHFFVILNNNTQSHQPTSVQSSEVVSNLNNVKNITSQTTTCFSENFSGKVNKSDVHKNNSLQINTSNASVTIPVENSVTSNAKYILNPHLNKELSSQLSTFKSNNDQTCIQVFKSSNTVNNSQNPLNCVTIPLSSSQISNANLNLFTSSSSTNPSSSKAESLSKLDSKFKTTHPKAKQVLSKPIKNIQLGKDKYAIQQISIPMKIGSIHNEYDKDVFYPQESHINLPLTNERNLCGNTISENNSKQVLCSVSSQLTMNNISNSINLNELNTLNETTNNLNTNFAPKLVPSELNLKSSTLNPNNTNSIVTNQNSITTNTSSVNFNVVPVSETLQTNRNVTITNTNKLVQSNNPPNALINNLDSSNSYVQIKVAPSQNRSLATLKELFPPPISMVPVCIMAPIHNSNQVTTSKVVILKGPGQHKVIPQKVQLNHIDSRQRSISKKQSMKFKKTGPKTVRQLLQERRKQNISKLLYDNNKERKEVKVLKPVLKLPISTNISSTTVVHTSTINATATSNSNCVTVASTSSNKRPNILLLPSSLKPAKKMITPNERLSMLMKEQEPEFVDNFSVFENPEETLSPFLSSTLNRKDCRPRHYDMSELQIGFFKVSDDIDSCGRFRSKFKVIFNKRQFLYDFPVSRCNQMSLKSTHVWEQMARIVVPFKTIVSMKLRERAIQININSPPLICLGRLQARSGIIASATIYDTTIENDSSWGSIIRSSFHHKVILRKRQASKLRSFLCHFDDRFITLTSLGICETGFGNASEVSIFEGELSPNSLKKNFFKNKKSRIRRLPTWDSSDNEDQKECNEGEILLSNQMCSCRISCRSVRCSCVKGAKSCSSICDCINCDNPLNILESLGLNLEFSLRDSCLFQNIYPIPKLIPFLSKEVKLSCCNTFARVQDCIPGTVLCPNVDCNVPLEFSWCRKMVCYPERNPRNHCSFCGQCCFSNGRHCYTCNKCFVVSPKFPYCPTCRDKTSTNINEFEPNECIFDPRENIEDKKITKSGQKPEIILLDAYSISKKSSSEDKDEILSYQDSVDSCLIEIDE